MSQNTTGMSQANRPQFMGANMGMCELRAGRCGCADPESGCLVLKAAESQLAARDAEVMALKDTLGRRTRQLDAAVADAERFGGQVYHLRAALLAAADALDKTGFSLYGICDQSAPGEQCPTCDLADMAIAGADAARKAAEEGA